MERTALSCFTSIFKGILLLLALTLIQGVQGIGVNYGTLANNLPPPAQVAKFLLQSTIINRVRLFDANPEILHAFADTGIEITITVPNDQIPHITNLSFAQQWVNTNVQPFIPATNLVRILVGNEVLSTANKLLISNLVPAMQTLHTALMAASLDNRIKVSTPHSLGILSYSSPPSSGKFRQGYDTHVLKPMLSFLKDSNAPFMVNPYPFFGCSADTLDYALFRPNSGVLDDNTKLQYTNMFDAQLDAVYSALKVLGFEDIEIVIAETGWPSVGDPAQVGVDPKSASEYNGNLIRHVTSGAGTPLMPNRTFDTYIFALFDENLKPGPTCERNFGLFRPNMTPVYDIKIMKNSVAVAQSSFPMGLIKPNLIFSQEEMVVHSQIWAYPEAWQRNIGYICRLGLEFGPVLECWPLQERGSCFALDTVRSHVAYAMNASYQAMRRNDYACDFGQTGVITHHR